MRPSEPRCAPAHQHHPLGAGKRAHAQPNGQKRTGRPLGQAHHNQSLLVHLFGTKRETFGRTAIAAQRHPHAQTHRTTRSRERCRPKQQQCPRFTPPRAEGRKGTGVDNLRAKAKAHGKPPKEKRIQGNKSGPGTDARVRAAGSLAKKGEQAVKEPTKGLNQHDDQRMLHSVTPFRGGPRTTAGAPRGAGASVSGHRAAGSGADRAAGGLIQPRTCQAQAFPHRPKARCRESGRVRHSCGCRTRARARRRGSSPDARP